MATDQRLGVPVLPAPDLKIIIATEWNLVDGDSAVTENFFLVGFSGLSYT